MLILKPLDVHGCYSIRTRIKAVVGTVSVSRMGVLAARKEQSFIYGQEADRAPPMKIAKRRTACPFYRDRQQLVPRHKDPIFDLPSPSANSLHAALARARLENGFGVARFTSKAWTPPLSSPMTIRSRPDFLSSVRASVLRCEMVPTWQRSLRSSVSSMLLWRGAWRGQVTASGRTVDAISRRPVAAAPASRLTGASLATMGTFGQARDRFLGRDECVWLPTGSSTGACRTRRGCPCLFCALDSLETNPRRRS